MIRLTPMSEDFLYWDPEAICRYPEAEGVEDNWFIKEETAKARKEISRFPASGEVIYAF